MIRIPIWVVEGVATVLLAISTYFNFFLRPFVSIGHPGVSNVYLSLQDLILFESCLIGCAGHMADVVDGIVHCHLVAGLIHDGASLDQLEGGQHVAGEAGD